MSDEWKIHQVGILEPVKIRMSKPWTPGGYREFLTLAFPLIVSNASFTLMHFTDRLFLAWAGPEQIAACLPAGILFFTFMSFFMGVSEYTNTFVAQYYGAERPASIGLAVWQGIFISLIGGFLSFLVLPLGIFAINHSGHAPEVVHLEKIYFFWLYYGGVFFILNGALSSFYSGRSKTRIIMIFNCIANGVNAVLDYALIFGKWGFPRWGIAGAAIATVTGTTLLSLMYLFCILSHKNDRIYHTRRSIRIDKDLFYRLLRFGLPTGMQYILDCGSFTVFVFLIGTLGTVELAASNIVLSINFLAFYPMIGAGIAVTTLVGQYIGRKDLRTAERSVYTALVTVEAYMLFFALIYYFFPHTLMEWFRGGSDGNDTLYNQVMNYGARILCFVAIYQISDAMTITFTGALRGAGDTLFTMWISIIAAWTFFVPGTWIIIRWTGGDVFSVWLWATAYISLLGIAYLIRFRLGHWKKIKVISDK